MVSVYETWRPELLDLGRAEDRTTYDHLLVSSTARFVHDTLDEQLRELMALRDPVRTWPRAELDHRVRLHLAGRELQAYGTWVWFPWSARLVHVLPRDELRESWRDVQERRRRHHQSHQGHRPLPKGL